ncbi:MAG: DUF454 family protein, partial [Pseudomonadota bacterium]
MISASSGNISSNRVLKTFLIIVGILSVGLGLVGIFVPVLPTTPFLLLASACFLRSEMRASCGLMDGTILCMTAILGPCAYPTDTAT